MNKIIILIALFTFAVQADEKVIPRDQKKWIAKTVKILKKFKPSDKTKFVNLKKRKPFSGDTKFYYDITRKGVIKIVAGRFVSSGRNKKYRYWRYHFSD